MNKDMNTNLDTTIFRPLFSNGTFGFVTKSNYIPQLKLDANNFSNSRHLLTAFVVIDNTAIYENGEYDTIDQLIVTMTLDNINYKNYPSNIVTHVLSPNSMYDRNKNYLFGFNHAYRVLEDFYRYPKDKTFAHNVLFTSPLIPVGLTMKQLQSMVSLNFYIKEE